MKEKIIKKGFTIAELIAVILVIGLIAMIAVPFSIKLSEKTKLCAFRDSVYSALDSIGYYIADSSSGTNLDEILVGDLNIKNNNFKSGSIIKRGKKYYAAQMTDGTYCANGDDSDLAVYKGPCDNTIPSCTFTVDGTLGDNNWYTSSVDIKFETSVATTSKIYYSIDNEDYNNAVKENKSGKYTFTLSEDGMHSFTGYVENGSRTKSTCNVDIKVDRNAPNIYVDKDNETKNVTISDTIGIVGYNITTDDNDTTLQNLASLKSFSTYYDISTFNTYNIYAKDEAGNTRHVPFCSVESFESWEYSFTGSEQTFFVPCKGIYRLELTGAEGESTVLPTNTAKNSPDSTSVTTCNTQVVIPSVTADMTTGGEGSTISGRVNLNHNDNLYIYVGGKGGLTSPGTAGYNGGGTGYSGTTSYLGVTTWGKSSIPWVTASTATKTEQAYVGAGGGGSDIRLNGNQISNRIIAAGGGGGAGWASQNYYSNNGNGGGCTRTPSDAYRYGIGAAYEMNGAPGNSSTNSTTLFNGVNMSPYKTLSSNDVRRITGAGGGGWYGGQLSMQNEHKTDGLAGGGGSNGYSELFDPYYIDETVGGNKGSGNIKVTFISLSK